eukprot:scaffold23382_cov115-Skeletonema_dohrnii-CCMP3373.AAC.6
MSSPSIVAWAFALSPFPAYLPQYFSLIRQTSAENKDDDTRTSLRSHGSENALVEEQHEVIIDRGIDSLRKRNNLHDSPSSTKIKVTTAAPHSAGLLIQGLGSPSKSQIVMSMAVTKQQLLVAPVLAVQQRCSYSNNRNNNTVGPIWTKCLHDCNAIAFTSCNDKNAVANKEKGWI